MRNALQDQRAALVPASGDVATAGTWICQPLRASEALAELSRASIAMERELLTPHLAISMESASAQIGDRVSFRISDIYLPEPSEVLAQLTPDLEANGVVVEFSDSGSKPRAYAVVRLTAKQSVLLSVTALRVMR